MKIVVIYMVDLNYRQADILMNVINEGYCSIKKFAKKYEVSSRTIYREINYINKNIKKFKICIKNSDKGLKILGDEENILNLKLELPYFRKNLEAENRKKLILLELLENKSPVKMDYFALKFDVSPSTISYYMKDIKKWLKNQNIKLITKNGVGTYIEGQEKDIRHAIISFLYENVNTQKLLSFAKIDYEIIPNINNEISIRMLNILDYKTINSIKKCIDELKKSLKYKLDDRVYVEIVIHLALAIKRLEKNENIKMDEISLNELSDTKEFKYAEILADLLSKEFKFKIPKEEIGYITLHLKGISFFSENNSIYKGEIKTVCNLLIEESCRIFKKDFKKDEILKKDLENHLIYTISRLKSGFEIRNPLINEIKDKYEELFNKCNKSVDVIRKKFNIHVNEDEVGYIAMHFGASIERMKFKYKKFNVLVVCSSGMGTSRMLVAKLKSFPQLNIVGVSSVINIENISLNNKIDLIISTIPIKNNKIPSIEISPLLSKQDIEKLKEALNFNLQVYTPSKEKEISDNEIEKIKKIKDIGYESNILIKNTYYKEINKSSKKEIINCIMEELLHKKVLNQENIKEIKQIFKERDNSAIILPNNGFAIYHCACEGIKESVFYLGKLKKSIQLKNILGEYDDISIVFVMIAPSNNKIALNIIGSISAFMIESGKFLNSLFFINHESELKNLIENIILKNIYCKIKMLDV